MFGSNKSCLYGHDLKEKWQWAGFEVHSLRKAHSDWRNSSLTTISHCRYTIDDMGLSALDKVNPSARPADVKSFYTLTADGTMTAYTSIAISFFSFHVASVEFVKGIRSQVEVISIRDESSRSFVGVCVREASRCCVTGYLVCSTHLYTQVVIGTLVYGVVLVTSHPDTEISKSPMSPMTRVKAC